jgi:hypothetical protein
LFLYYSFLFLEVIIMAWTSPNTVAVGDAVTASMYNTYVRDNSLEIAPFFTGWVSYTPQIDQGASVNIAKTVNYAKYLRVGNLVMVQLNVTFTAGGTGGSAVTITLPSGLTVTNGLQIGNGIIYDTSVSTPYHASVYTVAGKMQFSGDWSGAGTWGQTPNTALASGDNIAINATYEKI